MDAGILGATDAVACLHVVYSSPCGKKQGRAFPLLPEVREDGQLLCVSPWFHAGSVMTPCVYFLGGQGDSRGELGGAAQGHVLGTVGFEEALAMSAGAGCVFQSHEEPSMQGRMEQGCASADPVLRHRVRRAQGALSRGEASQSLVNVVGQRDWPTYLVTVFGDWDWLP